MWQCQDQVLSIEPPRRSDPGRSNSVAGQHTLSIEAEDVVEPAEGQPRSEAHAQLDDFSLGIVSGHAFPELVVESVVVEGVSLGVFGSEACPVVEGIGGAPVGDSLIERRLHRLAVTLGAPVLTEDSPVDLSDPEPGRLELTEAESSVCVDLLGEPGGRGSDAGDHLSPHVADRILAFGYVDIHVSTSEFRAPSLPTPGVSGTSSAS